jgi:hypothetical protein
MGAFRVYLRVVSSVMMPEQITEWLGAEPDETSAIGGVRWGRPKLPRREHTTWMRHTKPESEDARPEDLLPQILAWGEDFAKALGRLVDSTDAVVFLEVVQEVTDLEDTNQKGFGFDSEMIAWLALAKASVDIDQYIYHDCEEEAPANA